MLLHRLQPIIISQPNFIAFQFQQAKAVIRQIRPQLRPGRKLRDAAGEHLVVGVHRKKARALDDRRERLAKMFPELGKPDRVASIRRSFVAFAFMLGWRFPGKNASSEAEMLIPKS